MVVFRSHTAGDRTQAEPKGSDRAPSSVSWDPDAGDRTQAEPIKLGPDAEQGI